MDYSLSEANCTVSITEVCLNPYSNGLLSEFLLLSAINWKKVVLILILMDYSLSYNMLEPMIEATVLILILMDYSLSYCLVTEAFGHG